MMFYIKMTTRSGRLRMHALTLILQTLIPRQFLPATDKRFFQQRTWNKIQKKKFPQKRKWFRQATAILLDYMKGGTSIRARTIRSYLLVGTRHRLPERRTLQTTLANRPTDLTEAIDRLPPEMYLIRLQSVCHPPKRTYIRTPRLQSRLRF